MRTAGSCQPALLVIAAVQQAPQSAFLSTPPLLNILSPPHTHTQAYHPLCARMAGLHMEHREGKQPGQPLQLVSFCYKHCTPHPERAGEARSRLLLLCMLCCLPAAPACCCCLVLLLLPGVAAAV